MMMTGGVRHGGILYRSSPTYVLYVAGEDGSIWKGDLEDGPAEWFRPKPHWRGQHLYVWLNIPGTKEYAGSQSPWRMAGVILEAFGNPRRKDYRSIGYHDGNPENLRPDNLYWYKRRPTKTTARKERPAPRREMAGYTPTAGDVRRVLWFLSKGWDVEKVARRCHLNPEDVQLILVDGK
jgi:hypothetical protein